MSEKEFIRYIASIGFKPGKWVDYYQYKGFRIYLYTNSNHYSLNSLDAAYLGSCDYSDLTPIEKYFKRELRSIKLKKLLR